MQFLLILGWHCAIGLFDLGVGSFLLKGRFLEWIKILKVNLLSRKCRSQWIGLFCQCFLHICILLANIILHFCFFVLTLIVLPTTCSWVWLTSFDTCRIETTRRTSRFYCLLWLWPGFLHISVSYLLLHFSWCALKAPTADQYELRWHIIQYFFFFYTLSDGPVYQ